MEIKIVSRWDNNKVLLVGKYKNIKDCLEKNRDADLRDADLRGADLENADLRDADLRGAYLRDADLRGAENYLNSHDIWIELISRQPIKDFTSTEWSIIGQIITHRLCWDSIKKRYGKKIMPVFKKLSKLGFDEWEKYYKDKERA